MSLSPSDWIAGYAAVIATGVLFLEIRRWFESGVRLKLRLTPDMIVVGNPALESRMFVHVSVSNCGDRPTTITNLIIQEFEPTIKILRRKPIRSAVATDPSIINNQPLPHVLYPGMEWGGSIERNENVDEWISTGNSYIGVCTSNRRKPHYLRIAETNES